MNQLNIKISKKINLKITKKSINKSIIKRNNELEHSFYLNVTYFDPVPAVLTRALIPLSRTTQPTQQRTRYSPSSSSSNSSTTCNSSHSSSTRCSHSPTSSSSSIILSSIRDISLCPRSTIPALPLLLLKITITTIRRGVNLH